jgi:outer membrane protein TolC
MKKTFIILLFLKFVDADAQQVFSDLESFLTYASSKSISLKSGNIKMDQAKKAKIAAIASIPDPTGDMSFSFTNNLKLPVTLFPANFNDPNAPADEFRVQRLGLQYNSTLSNYGEIKLFNLQGWHNLRSARYNLEATALDNRITQKALYEDIASTYFNIVQLHEQLQAAKDNLVVSDTLLQIADAKFNQGLLRKQDVNDTRVNYLNTQESANQITFIIQQQYLTLKALADISDKDSITINHSVTTDFFATAPEVSLNNLNFAYTLAKEKVALASFRKSKSANHPTLSFFLSNSQTQYNTNASLFDRKWDWYNATSIGLKLSAPIPISANRISSVLETKYNHLLAQKNTERVRIKAELDNKQLGTDYQKAWSQFVTNREVYQLKRESYYKNKNLYTQGLLSTEQTLNSFSAMVTSNYNLITSAISLLLANAKIEIHNTIK